MVVTPVIDDRATSNEFTVCGVTPIEDTDPATGQCYGAVPLVP